jgi:RNA polymerase sigma-70 factor, ECF subfamily
MPPVLHCANVTPGCASQSGVKDMPNGEQCSRDSGPPGSRAAAAEALFNEMVVQHMDGLYRTARRLTSRVQDADDLVQETYLRAWRSLHTYRTGSNPKAWLSRIMHNVHIDGCRASTRVVPTIVQWEWQDPAFVAGETPETLVVSPLMEAEVRDALRQIPEVFRTCLILSDVRGLSGQEIARLLRIPQGTVISRVFRARRKMRGLLAEYGREYGYLKAG